MTGKTKWLSFLIVVVFSVFFISCAHAKPPKPGPNFVWVESHETPDGDVIPGYWKYTGPPVKGKVWVRGHHSADGSWVAGHWKVLTPPPRKGANWVPGHYGPRGRWIPGHWR